MKLNTRICCNVHRNPLLVPVPSQLNLEVINSEMQRHVVFASEPTFRSNILPPSSGSKNKTSKKAAWAGSKQSLFHARFLLDLPFDHAHIIMFRLRNRTWFNREANIEHQRWCLNELCCNSSFRLRQYLMKVLLYRVNTPSRIVAPTSIQWVLTCVRYKNETYNVARIGSIYNFPSGYFQTLKFY
jgi:hypothetical protein